MTAEVPVPPLAVIQWRRLPAGIRQALPTAEDLAETVTRTVREIESTIGTSGVAAMLL